MASIPVVVKHRGKKYDVDLDPTSTGELFKFQLYSLTGVEPDRQKVLVKGGQLKDDTDLSKLSAKPGQTFMMMGTPAEGAQDVVRPKEQIKFVEDMTEAEAAQQVGATPAGLNNLGNTCYLNSTLQTLRAVPELQEQLINYRPAPASSGAGGSALGNLASFGLGSLGGSLDLATSLRDLYKQMSETQEGFPPIVFLNALRQAFPQFAEKSKSGNGFAQQDAEEAWSQIVQHLRPKLKIKPSSTAESSTSSEVTFIDKYLAGSFSSITDCDEQAAKDAGEEPVSGEDVFLKLNCHISKDTNHLRDGIAAALEEKLEKKSPVLDRDAIYTKKSKISRLPKYLTVHFVRFFWKREAQKKAKVMRKVTFPRELDVVEFCTDDLRSMLVPVRDKLREIRKDESDMVRAQKRRKVIHEEEAAEKAAGVTKRSEGKKKPDEKSNKDGKAKDGDTEMEDAVYKTDSEIDAERAATILSAKKELLSLVNPKLAEDDATSKSGLYELRGIVTHQGASADSGHYTAYVKKQGPLDPKTGVRGEEDGKWWWFNDDKVSEVEVEKIDGLSGGGESHSALILLYQALSLPTVEGA